MTIKGTVASFAHLLGMSAKKAEEDDDKKRDDETDEEYAKRMEDKKEEEEQAKKAEEDKEAARKAEEEKEEEEKAKKAKKAEEDEDEKQKAARKSERARCRAIFASASAGTRPDMAAHLAFDTDMDAKAAVALLNVAAAGGVVRPGLGSRMATVTLPKLGVDTGAPPGASTPEGAAAAIIAAGKKRRGEV